MTGFQEDTPYEVIIHFRYKHDLSVLEDHCYGSSLVSSELEVLSDSFDQFVSSVRGR